MRTLIIEYKLINYVYMGILHKINTKNEKEFLEVSHTPKHLHNTMLLEFLKILIKLWIFPREVPPKSES